ncbi:GntR family transcriptional regulator [Nocardioides sp. DS6]|uniref:GntR family transcriptional regulator n=1 Tax=Nocardioides eburneus TaxID=3231482 RepID=A0ABV3SYU1_9ACTN
MKQRSTRARADDVRQRLRAALLQGRYAPRQRLIEAELAEEYAVSRFVIRNVLHQLEAESLVEVQPHRGARVRELSLAEALEITELRQSVEGLIAARAAERISPAQIDGLQRLGRAMADAVEGGELVRYSESNAALHASLREIAANATATALLERLNAQMVRHQFMLSLIPGRPRVSLPEHLDIIVAVCAHEPAAAESAMRRHIGSVLRAIAESDAAGSRAPGMPGPAKGMAAAP